VTPHQTPGKWTFGVQGDLVIARRKTPVTEPAALPPEVQHSLDSPLAGVRAGVAGELARLMSGRHQGLALAARRALEDLADDDSRTVAAAATAALGRSDVASHGGLPDTGLPDTSSADATGPAPPTGATGPAEPSGTDTTATTPGQPPGRTTPTARSPRRSWPATIRGRIVLAVLAAAVLVGGAVTWRVLDQDAQSTIPESFDGRWRGEISAGRVLTATLDKYRHQGDLASGANGCYNGALSVRKATDSKLTMRFSPADPAKCNTWTVDFTHLAGGDLNMAVDPDNNRYHEDEFQVQMTRQG
jgi:hypothetical protein